MKTLSLAVMVLPCMVPLAHGAISFTAVGVYDAGTNGNVVDASQTALTAAAHGSNVAAAFANGTGGVVNFDNGTGSSGNWTVAYGAGLSLDVVVTGGQLNMLTSDVALIKATPISGNAYYRMGGTSTTLAFNSTFLSEFGLTLLARSTDRNLGSIVVTLSDGSTATVSGSSNVTLTANTVTASSNYLTESGSGVDRFFGYKAPDGKAITQIVVNGVDNLVMDDFGFITSPIPEPSVALLGVAGMAVGVMRRRRR